MKTPAQRGAFGRWLHEKRTARYATQAEARAEMRRLAGLDISESEYAMWESGSRTPMETNPKVQGLYAFFGGRPEEATLGGDASVAAAIRDQTEVLRELVAELRSLRDSQQGMSDGLASVLGALSVGATPPRPRETRTESGRQ